MKGRGWILQAALFAAGLTLLAGVIREADTGKVLEALRHVRGWGWLFLGLYPLISLWDVWGWALLLPRPPQYGNRMRDLFWIRIAGEAWNQITPFVDVGGEAIKVRFTSRAFGLNRRFVLVSVVLERTAFFLSETIFWCVGLVPLVFFFDVSPRFKFVCVLTLLIGICVAVLMIRAQKGGFLGGWAAALRRKMWPRNKEGSADYWAGAAEDVESEIRAFYALKNSSWLVSVLLHVVGWITGGVETFWMLKILGSEVSLVEALVFETILHLARTASFFIPQNLGAQEGALALVAGAVGLPSSAGIALSLLKRVRQWFWVAVGLCVWGWLERRLPAPPERVEIQR